MKIYLISLGQDTLRRTELAQRFPKTYPIMQWVKAVNGKDLSAKEYFSYARQYFNTHQKIITPSEVGCTLSHINALEFFLETDEEYCLILEDDVIGNDENISYIESLIEQLNPNGLILCGGQEGLNFWKYILGKNILENFYKIPVFSIKFLFRTCSYVVDKKTAKYILKRQQQNFEVADAWYTIFKDSNIPFLYLDLFKHPEDLSNSHIENERANFYMEEMNFFKRIYKQGVFWKIYNRIRNDLFRWVLILKGHKQIHKQRENDD